MDLKNPKTLKMVIIGGGGLAVILLLVLLLILMNREDDGIQTPTQQDSSEGVELTYWGLWELENVMEPIIQEYETNNPGVKIKYTQRPFSNEDYETTLHTRLKQGLEGEAPAADIVKINNTWLPRFEELLAPIPENVITHAEYSQKFYPTSVEDFTGSNGQLYAMPIGIDGLALFYNKELLQQEGVSEPPRDWDGVTELARQLTKKDGSGNITQAGLAMGTENNVSHSADIFSFLLLQNNIEVMNIENDGLRVNLDDNKVDSALTFYKSFEQRHEVWSSDLPLDLDMFFRGELAMFFAPSWRVFDIIEAAPHIEFDVAPAPRLLANEPVYYSMYWGETVSASSPHQQEAWEFINFLAQQETLKKLYSNSSTIRAFGQPYPTKALASELEGARYVSPILDMAPDMKSWKLSQNPTVENHINLGIAENNMEIAQQRINEYLAEL